MISKKILIDQNQEEIVQPVMLGFPLKFVRQEFSPHTFHFIDWHWHMATQYCYIDKGSILFQIGKQKEIFYEGEGLFINSGQVHTSRPDKPNNRYLCLNVSPFLVGDESSSLYQHFVVPLLQNTAAPYLSFRKDDPDTAPMLALIHKCCQHAARGKEYFDLELLSDLIRLWSWTLKAAPDFSSENTPPARENLRLQQILIYLNLNYGHSLTLKDIADEIHLSRNECSRFFHEITGQPLFTYLTELRIAKAIELLLKSSLTVTEIALETGFGSQSYFTQRFRQIKGMTPSEFRKKHRL